MHRGFGEPHEHRINGTNEKSGRPNVCRKAFIFAGTNAQRIGAAVGRDGAAGAGDIGFLKIHQLLNGLAHHIGDGLVYAGMGDEHAAGIDALRLCEHILHIARGPVAAPCQGL